MMLNNCERDGFLMENYHIDRVPKQECFFFDSNKKNQPNVFDNIRFVLNANNHQMQMLAQRNGFNDFKEMVETYYAVSHLSFQDVEGDLELLCNIIL
jgi:hypothetical protein